MNTETVQVCPHCGALVHDVKNHVCVPVLLIDSGSFIMHLHRKPFADRPKGRFHLIEPGTVLQVE